MAKKKTKKKEHGKIRLKRLRVKKRSKKVQKFMPEKIQKAVTKVGCKKRVAAQTTRDVVNYILHTTQTPIITFKNVAKTVIKELKKKDGKAAKTFEENMKKKRL